MQPATAEPQPHGIEAYANRASDKQIEAHRLCRIYDEFHLIAGRQFGKTDWGSAQLNIETVLEPRAATQDFLIAAPTYDKTLAARFRYQEMLPWGCWEFRASEKRYIVKGKDGAVSNVWIRNADPDAARGLTLDGAWVDEAAFCDEPFYDNLRPALSVRNGRLRTTTTPVGRNHHFRFYSPLPENVGVLFAESRDNPVYSEAQWQAAIRRYGFDSPFFQQEHRAIAAAFVGQAVPKFAAGIIEPAKWSDEWTTVVGMDFGWTAGTAALLAQITPMDSIIIHGLKFWTETERHIICASLDWPWCDSATPVYCIDPSGSSGRAPEAGDTGWLSALEDMYRIPSGESLVDVRWNRLIGESASLNMIRILAERKKIIIADSAIAEVHGGRGEGAYEIQRILQGAKLSKNLEKDELDDSHPEADVMDALRYICAVMLPELQRSQPVVTKH